MRKSLIVLSVCVFAVTVLGVACDKNPVGPDSKAGDIQPKATHLSLGEQETFTVGTLSQSEYSYTLTPATDAFDVRNERNKITIDYIKKSSLNQVELRVQWYCGGGATCYQTASIFLE